MQEDEEWSELEAGLVAGVPRAWEQLYRVTHLPLLRTLTRMLGNPQAAEDALQTSFIEAMRARERFDPAKGSAGAWLAGIAKNVGRSALRDQAKAAQPSDALDALPADDGWGTAEPEIQAGGSVADRVLDAIDPAEAELLRRKYLRGQSLEEMARDLGVKRGTVGSLLHRARASFRVAYARVISRGR